MGKLNFRTISVRKAPGFRNGLSADGFNELSPDINIISGPNGAGKSTTARIIQQLIWHNHTKGLDIDGKFELDNNPWSVHIDSSYLRIQKNGIDEQPVGIPAAETQKKYMLALHELVNLGDEDLAKRILDESVGGYDLEAAQQDLEYSGEIKKKNSAAYTNYKNAHDRFNDITRNHKELKGKEDTLSQLETEKGKAQNASKLKSLFEKVLAFLQSKSELAETLAILDTFPDVLKEANGEEYNRIEELEKDINKEYEDIVNAINTITDNEKSIKELPIPIKGIDDQILRGLKKRIDSLASLEIAVLEHEPEIKELEKAELIAKNRIANITNPHLWKSIELEEVGNLDNFFQNALTVLQQKISIDTEINKLGSKTIIKRKDQETLNNGIRILSEWLKEQKSPKGISFRIILLVSLLGIISVIGTYFIGLAGLLGIPLILAFLVFAFLRGRNNIVNQILNIRQNDFKNTGLSLPERWETELVSARLKELMKDLNEEILIDIKENDRLAQLKVYEDNLKRLQTEIDDVEKTRGKLLAKLNAMPEFPKNAGDTQSTLYLFLVQLKEWQSAYADVVAKIEAQEERKKQKEQELNNCNLVFDTLQANRASDSISAGSEYDRLTECENKRRESQRTIEDQKKRITDCQGRLDTSKTRVAAIYKKLGIDNEDIDNVRKLMDQFPGFADANKRNSTAFTNAELRKTDLRNHPLYDDHEAEILSLDIYKVQARISELGSKADQLASLNDQIVEIRTVVNQKKQGGELEEVLAAKKNAENDLENLYAKNLSSITGSLLVEHLKRETGEQNRPMVFKEADRIFRMITRGRYELRVIGNNGPVFKAYDTVQDQGLDLTEISIGTRVQLLISIRLAFIESIENNIKLPILADELLANSDDMRADAVIEALYEISKGGRQIFYFTAKPDEARKWESFLKDKNDISYKLIRLDGALNTAAQNTIHKSEFNALNFVQKVREPGQLTMKEYRKELKIPIYDLISNDSSQLSISHLTENVDLLYNCLKPGIKTWGELSSYYTSNGKVEGLNNAVFKEMKIKFLLFERFQELYRIGRPQKISMDILEDSGAISRPFTDQVKQKLDEVNGNPADLIESLQCVPRFRQDKIEHLREYLTEKGYLNNEKPLSGDEIRVLLQAKISSLNMNPEEAQNFINGIIG